jgi:hypothetical protein
MPRGGYREGAGRKPGVPNVKKKLLAQVESKLGITPLEVILAGMRHHMGVVEGEYRKEPGERDDKRLEAALGKATEAAEKAAPYLHPRKASITHEDVTPHPSVIRAPEVFKDSASWLAACKPAGISDATVNDLPPQHPARKAMEGLDALDAADKVISDLRTH